MNKILKIALSGFLTFTIFSMYSCSDDDDSGADCNALTNDYNSASETFAEALGALFEAGFTGEGDVDALTAAFSSACDDQSSAIISWVDGGCGSSTDLGLSTAGLDSLRDGSFCAELTGSGLQILNEQPIDN
tara:strand:+ start:183 stop:578 length:396 start_codon:yes stop_codon:yes gene_type:complete